MPLGGLDGLKVLVRAEAQYRGAARGGRGLEQSDPLSPRDSRVAKVKDQQSGMPGSELFEQSGARPEQVFSVLAWRGTRRIPWHIAGRDNLLSALDPGHPVAQTLGHALDAGDKH